MANDLFQQSGINMDQPRDLFSEKGIDPSKNLMFDPANETSTGTFVPQGTYEKPYARTASQAITNAFMPGMSLLPRLATSGLVNSLIGATDVNRPAQSALEGGLGGLLAGAAPEAFNMAEKGYNAVKRSFNPPQATMTNELMPTKEGYSPYKPQYQWGSNPSEINKPQPFQPPSFLMDQPQVASPEEHAANMMQTISKGQTPEQAGQALSQHVQDTFAPINENGKQQYENLFNQPIENNKLVRNAKLYPYPDPLTGIQREGEYINTVGESKSPFGNKNLDMLHQRLMSNGDVDTAHTLQSQLGNAARDLKETKAAGNLDQNGIEQMRFYNQARNSLINDTRNTIDNVLPGGGDAYDAATQNWKNNVRPYLDDAVLRKIVTGKLNNPTTAQINSTFKNPEGDISKVVSDLGQQGKDNISYIGMGKLPEENAPNQLISGYKSLQKKGLGSYMSPENQQSFGELGQHINNAQAAAQQQVLNQRTIDLLKQQFEKSQNAMNVSPVSNAPLEANAITKGTIQQQNKALASRNALAKLYKGIKKIPLIVGYGIGKIL